MKAFCLLGVTLVAARLCATPVLTDNFNGTAIDSTLWQASAPLSDSQIGVSGGNAIFTQRGILVSQAAMPNAIEIDGRFAFGGGIYDQFQITLRTDGLIDTPYYNFDNNIYVGFNRQGSDDGSKNGIENIGMAAGWSTPGKVGNFLFQTDVYYDFRIVDTGSKITLYLDDLTNPFMSVDTTERTGNLIGLENRGVVPWFPTFDNQVKLDYITVSTVPDSGTYCGLVGALFVGMALIRRRISPALR
jgi:hypothetical protein